MAFCILRRLGMHSRPCLSLWERWHFAKQNDGEGEDADGEASAPHPTPKKVLAMSALCLASLAYQSAPMAAA